MFILMLPPDEGREFVDVEVLHDLLSVVFVSVDNSEGSVVFGQLLGSGDVLGLDQTAMSTPGSVEHGEHEGVFFHLLSPVLVVE